MNRDPESCRQNALKRWYGDYKPERCPRCRGTRTIHSGYRKTRAGQIQCWRCHSCGRRWMERQTSAWKHLAKRIAAANQPRCAWCKGTLPAGRRLYCCDEHTKLGCNTKWHQRHIFGRRVYYRLRGQSLRENFGEGDPKEKGPTNNTGATK